MPTYNSQFSSIIFENELHEMKFGMKVRQFKYLRYAPELKKKWTKDEPTTRS